MTCKGGVIISEKRFRQLLENERKTDIKTIKACINLMNFLTDGDRKIDNYKGVSLKKIIAGFEAELKELIKLKDLTE